MSEPPEQPRPDIVNEHATRAEFTKIASARIPTELTVDKGDRTGQTFIVDAVPKGPTTFEYRGIVGKKLIASMEMRLPIGGFATVTSAKVAKDFRRSGVATKIYREINADLAQVGAKLEPHWGSMTPGAVRFWQDFGSDDAEMQARLAPILEEMKERGEIEAYDSEGDDWNGETIRKPRKPRA